MFNSKIALCAVGLLLVSQNLFSNNSKTSMHITRHTVNQPLKEYKNQYPIELVYSGEWSVYHAYRFMQLGADLTKPELRYLPQGILEKARTGSEDEKSNVLVLWKLLFCKESRVQLDPKIKYFINDSELPEFRAILKEADDYDYDLGDIEIQMIFDKQMKWPTRKIKPAK